MKRSELVLYMEELCFREGIEPWNVSVSEFCSEMLSMMTEQGMLPPEIKHPRVPPMSIYEYAYESA